MKNIFRSASIAGAGLYLFASVGLHGLHAQAVGSSTGLAGAHAAPQAVRAAPAQPAMVSPSLVRHSMVPNGRPGIGSVSQVPSGIGTVSRGNVGSFTDHRGNDRDQHRHHTTRRVPYYYGLNPDYNLGLYGSGLGGYGYPPLYVQTYGYPLEAQQFQPAEAASIYVEPASSEEDAPAPRVAKPTPDAQAEPDSLVEDVQSELIRRGYYAGKANGIVSKDFQAALRRFQTDEHLAGSGLINQASLFALGLN